MLKDKLDKLKDRLKLRRTDYMSWIPKIQHVYCGYKGLDNGLCLLWHGHFLYLIKPINER